MNRQWINRIIIYLLGLLVLALGISLNAKAGLGVSPIISVAYSISLIGGLNFGNTTLGLYVFFVFLEVVIHFAKSRKDAGMTGYLPEGQKRRNERFLFLMDLLQIPLSIVFTRFLNVFNAILPDYSTVGEPGAVRLAMQSGALFIGIVCTGIGAAMSLGMRMIPNPGDGIVQAVADYTKKEVGFAKNCVDIINVAVSVGIGFVFAGRLTGVGVGTIVAVVGVGRVIAVFNHFFYEKMMRWAGMKRK